MLKKALAVVGLMLGAVSANAAVDVFEVINDSVTYNQVTLSSAVLLGTGTGSLQVFTASLISGATSFPTLMENRRALELCNEDATVAVRCVVDLSSTSANGDLSLSRPVLLSTTVGKKIAAGACVVYDMATRNLDGRILLPWCVNDGAAGTSKLGVTQVRSK